MEDEQSNHWHLDKKLNVGHLFTTLMLAGSMVVWAMTIETRIAEQGVKIETAIAQISRVEARTASSMQDITELFKRTDDKLDRLIERKQTN
jgi:hypothetical protein